MSGAVKRTTPGPRLKAPGTHKALWAEASSWQTRETRGALLGVWWNVVLLVASLAALPFDHRHILGLNPWIKPLKFEISVIVYLLTLALLLTVLGQDGRWSRLRARLGWGFGLSMIVENSVIALQSARGVRSHMNYTSWFNGIAFGVMGGFIALNTVLLAILLVLFVRARLSRPQAELWGIRLGLALLLAGSVEGVLIVASGGHTVGAADGGSGLPFVNWSTSHGDLRVAHFFALHALQLLWAAGWALGRLAERRSLPPWMATAALTAFAAGYAGGVWLLFAQAMAGRAVLAMP